MAEVFSNSPCMLGKRVLNAHPHTLMGAGGQLDFSSKKRRLGHGAADQGPFEQRQQYEAERSSSPIRAGKRARPLSPLQPSSSSHFPLSSDFGAFGFSQQQQHARHAESINSVSGRGADDVELTALRREIGALHALVAEKDSGLDLAREENTRLKDGVGLYQKEMERLTSENRILKRAVGIQNTKGKEVESQLHDLQQASGQAAEYMKRLEQTNYALSVRVQAMGNSGPSDFMGGQRPPDVF